HEPAAGQDAASAARTSLRFRQNHARHAVRARDGRRRHLVEADDADDLLDKIRTPVNVRTPARRRDLHLRTLALDDKAEIGEHLSALGVLDGKAGQARDAAEVERDGLATFGRWSRNEPP